MSVDGYAKEPIESSMIEQGFSRKLTVDGQKTIVTLLDVYRTATDDEEVVDTLLRSDLVFSLSA